MGVWIKGLACFGGSCWELRERPERHSKPDVIAPFSAPGRPQAETFPKIAAASPAHRTWATDAHHKRVYFKV
jgi:hypothetical protein